MDYYWIIFLFSAFFGSSHGDCGVPPRLQFGELQTQFVNQDSFSIGANVTYKCRSGYIRVPATSTSITCLNDSTWSTPETFCTRRSCGNPGDIANGKVSIIDTLFGSRVNYTCDLGYNMISRRNFRDCQSDGTWSNEVPVCEVQICLPPDAITDGAFHPDKENYEYLDAVTYQCNDKTSSLIGERTISCTANGTWSSDPPQCKAVECSNPNVDHAEKLSGFIGPYNLNSAVSFRCLPGYTMIGASSVICNSSSEWEPPLPTCSRIVTQSPTTTTKETENGGGSNAGAIVGGVIAGIFGILFAASAIIYVFWFKRRRGDGYVGPARKNPDSGTSSSHQTPVEQCDMKQIEAQETC